MNFSERSRSGSAITLLLSGGLQSAKGYKQVEKNRKYAEKALEEFLTPVALELLEFDFSAVCVDGRVAARHSASLDAQTHSRMKR